MTKKNSSTIQTSEATMFVVYLGSFMVTSKDGVWNVADEDGEYIGTRASEDEAHMLVHEEIADRPFDRKA